jgi:hypothetical protein
MPDGTTQSWTESFSIKVSEGRKKVAYRRTPAPHPFYVDFSADRLSPKYTDRWLWLPRNPTPECLEKTAAGPSPASKMAKLNIVLQIDCLLAAPAT